MNAQKTCAISTKRMIITPQPFTMVKKALRCASALMKVKGNEEDDNNEPSRVVLGARLMRTRAATIIYSSKKSTLIIGLCMILFFASLVGIRQFIGNNKNAAEIATSSATTITECPDSLSLSLQATNKSGGKPSQSQWQGMAPNRRLGSKSDKAPTSKKRKCKTSKASVSNCCVYILRLTTCIHKL